MSEWKCLSISTHTYSFEFCVQYGDVYMQDLYFAFSVCVLVWVVFCQKCVVDNIYIYTVYIIVTIYDYILHLVHQISKTVFWFNFSVKPLFTHLLICWIKMLPDSGTAAICLNWLGIWEDRKTRPANTKRSVQGYLPLRPKREQC